MLEERPECGGSTENVEVMPGVLIDPHATYYGERDYTISPSTYFDMIRISYDGP